MAGDSTTDRKRVVSDAELWQRVRPLFDEVVDLDSDSRRVRLDEIARADPLMRSVLDRLLQVDSSSEAALRQYVFAGGKVAPLPASPPDPLQLVGHTMSHFRVTSYVAAGGMGVVYGAEDLQLGRTVALKFPLPHQRMDDTVKQRFINEARSAASLDHPNLCTVYEIGESQHGLFLTMPLYAGETLKDRVARDGPLTAADALDIVTQLTTGLASAHAAGIVHRDLKPANVMLVPGGGVKVLDFGLAKIRDVSVTKSKVALGTIRYMSPEQVRGGRVDERTDLWAIGVMLHEMLTGQLPFRGDHEVSVLHAILHDEPPPPSAVNASLTTPFDDLVGALLQKDPRHRYQSAEALLADIAALRAGAGLAHTIPFWDRTPQRRRVRRMVPALAALGGGVAIIAASWLAYGRNAIVASSSMVANGNPPLKFVHDTATVSSTRELLAALAPANAGRHLRIRAGTYDIDRLLTIPDGMTIEGEGVMRFTDGYPAGFVGPHAVLRMTAVVGGEMLTLGNGVTVRRVEVVDLDGRDGNVVAVVSRQPRDSVSATIVESVIINPNPYSIGAVGALGRSLFVITRNANLGAEPAPDEGSVLDVRLVRSVIRAPGGGGGFFAYNFAANSRIALGIVGSVIGGRNEANGGVSRPDAVHDSKVELTSQGNLYRNEWADQCVSQLEGWNLTGGSGTPIAPGVPDSHRSTEVARNRLLVRSIDDRLEGFTTGILATASRRFFAAALNPAPRNNLLELHLVRTRISTPACAAVGPSDYSVGNPRARPMAAADIRLIGAWVANDALVPGDSNILRAEFRGVTGSGRRANQYADAAAGTGSLSTELRGIGNRLEISGDSQTFAPTNRAIDPAPGAKFYTRRP